MEGRIFNIQRMSVQDGPGIRTTVFLKGCGLRCFWCHNPESLSSRPQIGIYPDKCIGCGACLKVCPNGARSVTPEQGLVFDRERCSGCGACAEVCYAGSIELFGRTVSPEEVLSEVIRDQVFYGQEGGVTFSGGEPLLQADFVAECARLCQEKGIPVALDTSLFAPDEALEKVLPYVDLFLIDCKAVTPSLHQKGTGQDNVLIQKHTRLVGEKGKRYWIRIPLIPGFNDNHQEFEKIGAFLGNLPAPPQRVEIMPFHNFCITKYQSLGMDYAAKDLPIPSSEQVKVWEDLLRGYGLKVQGK